MKRNAREDEDGDDGRDAQEALVSEAYRTAEADTGLLTGVRESSLIVQAGKKGSRIIASHASQRPAPPSTRRAETSKVE